MRSATNRGAYLRRRRGLEQRTWVLVYRAGQIDTAGAEAIIAQWDAAAGGAATFDWTPPGEVQAIRVRFLGNALDINPQSIVSNGCTLQLQQEVPV